MGFADLFKSTKEREREARRAKRQKERQVERVVDRIADRIKAQEKERAQIWAKAREMLQAGKKLDAQRLLQRYRGLEVLINRLERQQMLWRGKLNTIATAADANEAAAALAGFSELLNVDPDRIVDDLERVEDAEGEIKEVNSVLDRAYEKDNERIAAESEKLGDVPVDEDLMAALESEAAADICGGSLANASKTEDDINAGRDRLRALLDEK